MGAFAFAQGAWVMPGTLLQDRQMCDAAAADTTSAKELIEHGQEIAAAFHAGMQSGMLRQRFMSVQDAHSA